MYAIIVPLFGWFNGRNGQSKSEFSFLVRRQINILFWMLETYRFYNCIFAFWFFWKCFVHIWYNMITSKKRDENHQYSKLMKFRSFRKWLPFNFDFDCISSLFYQVFTDIMIHIKYLGTIDFNNEVSLFQPSFVCNCVENDLAKKEIRDRGKRVRKYAQKFHNITLGTDYGHPVKA